MQMEMAKSRIYVLQNWARIENIQYFDMRLLGSVIILAAFSISFQSLCCSIALFKD